MIRSDVRPETPDHAGMRCRCQQCGSPWWSTALGWRRHPACPFCGEAAAVTLRAEAVAAVVRRTPEPTFPPDADRLLQRGSLLRWYAAQLPAWARHHPMLVRTLRQEIEGQAPLPGAAIRRVLAVLAEFDDAMGVRRP